MAEFINGITVKQPHEKAPDFVMADIAIQAEKLITWLRDNMNERGYVNGTIKRSQKGTLYIEKNTYNKDQGSGYTKKSAQTSSSDDEDGIPF